MPADTDAWLPLLTAGLATTVVGLLLLDGGPQYALLGAGLVLTSGGAYLAAATDGTT